MKLTTEQRQILDHNQGVALIQAGPGCGKTQTLVMAIKNILRSGVKPRQVLVLTYNRNTASDFKIRLQKEGINGHMVMTFHSFGKSVIKEHSASLGFSSPPRVMNGRRGLNKIIDRLATKCGITNKALGKAFYTHRNDDTVECPKLGKALSELSKLHQEYKRQRGIIDFDDMGRLPLQLFKDPDILNKTAGRYGYLFVDELQDINGQQAKLLELLAPKMTTFMVGDARQMIYGFRQAATKHWNNVVKQLEPRIYHLTETFRCPQQSIPMINAVGADIGNDRPLVSNKMGLRPAFHVFADVDEQADFLARGIHQLLNRGVDLSDIACLTRINRTAEGLCLALEARGIPCSESGAKYNARVIEDGFKLIRALLRVARWVGDKTPHRVPKKAIRYITKVLRVDKRLAQKIMKNGWNELRTPSADSKYRQVLDINKAVRGAAKCEDIEQAVQLLIDGLRPLINKRYRRHKRQVLRDLSAIRLSVRGTTWADLKINDILRPAHNGGVTITTIHGSKGREWKYVALINVVEGEIPHYAGSDERLAEERRLFYVAITRHSKKLWVLQCPTSRPRYKNKGGYRYEHAVFGGESSLITPIKKYLVTR